jgi:hypothetical protein
MSPPDFDDEEPPTKPDRPLECPRCVDPETGRPTGRIVVAIEEGTTHRRFPSICPVCRGSKLISRARLERFRIEGG